MKVEGLINGCNACIIVTYNNVGINKITKDLRIIVEKGIENGEKVIIVGDLNARIGTEQVAMEGDSDAIRKSEDKIINAEGKKLLEFCEEYGGRVKNGCTTGDWDGELTFVGEGGNSVLDLLIEFESGEENVVEEIRVVPRIESDHLPVQFTIRGNTGTQPIRSNGDNSNAMIDNVVLRWKEEMQREYVGEMKELITNIDQTEDNIQKRWECLRDTITTVAKNLGMVRKEHNQNFSPEFGGEAREQRKIVWESLKKWLKSKDDEDKRKLKNDRVKLKEIRERLKREKLEQKWKLIEESRDMKNFWEAVGSFRPKKTRKGDNIKKNEWVKHFRQLLGANLETTDDVQFIIENTVRRVENIDETDAEDEFWNREIVLDEVEHALSKMKKNKTPGEDGITIEFLKELPRVWLEELSLILNGLWQKGEIVRGWETARICPIHKGGEEEDVTNYRGIALLDSGYKLLTNIMANRIRLWVEDNQIFRESQAGFRKKRSTRDQIFVLNCLINNKLRMKGGKLYVGFVDFKTAFDVVDRKILVEKLGKLGMKGKMLNMIKRIYNETKNEIRTSEGITESFVTKKGVRQGCPLSPSLFCLGLDDIDLIWEKRNEGGTVIGAIKIYCLKFADDIAIVSDDKEGLQTMLNDLAKYCDKNKMIVNAKKTKIMVFRKGGRIKKGEKWTYKGQSVEVVKNFKYLGYNFSTKNKYTNHMKHLAGKFQRAINAVWGVMKRAKISSLNRRLYLFDTLVKAGCLYGCEIWGWGKREEIERVQRRYIKMAMGISRNTPEYIWRMEAGRRSIEIGTKKRAASYLLRIVGMEQGRWPKVCLKEEVRNIKNNNPTAWGKELEIALKETGDGETIDLLHIESEKEKLSLNLERMVKVKCEQEIQTDWSKIDKSNYCKNYKRWKNNIEEEKYWESQKFIGEIKEQWARIRCGCVGREGKEYYKDTKCRICKTEVESLDHIVNCEVARQEIKKEWADELDAQL